jgi:hypothetical protein
MYGLNNITNTLLVSLKLCNNVMLSVVSNITAWNHEAYVPALQTLESMLQRIPALSLASESREILDTLLDWLLSIVEASLPNIPQDIRLKAFQLSILLAIGTGSLAHFLKIAKTASNQPILSSQVPNFTAYMDTIHNYKEKASPVRCPILSDSRGTVSVLRV